MVELNGTRDYFRKQWLEDDIVFSIDQGNLDSVELFSGEDPSEMHCDVNAAESATQNKNALLCHANVLGVPKRTLH
jgi:hypothetical protein